MDVCKYNATKEKVVFDADFSWNYKSVMQAHLE
jgi:hypothetical protein